MLEFGAKKGFVWLKYWIGRNLIVEIAKEEWCLGRLCISMSCACDFATRTSQDGQRSVTVLLQRPSVRWGWPWSEMWGPVRCMSFYPFCQQHTQEVHQENWSQKDTWDVCHQWRDVAFWERRYYTKFNADALKLGCLLCGPMMCPRIHAPNLKHLVADSCCPSNARVFVFQMASSIFVGDAPPPHFKDSSDKTGSSHFEPNRYNWGNELAWVSLKNLLGKDAWLSLWKVTTFTMYIYIYTKSEWIYRTFYPSKKGQTIDPSHKKWWFLKGRKRHPWMRQLYNCTILQQGCFGTDVVIYKW